MNIMRFLVTSLSVLALAACGTNSKETKPAPKVTEAAAVSESAKLPAVTLIRVPVDASGKEDHTKAEMHLVNTKDVSASNVATVFSSSPAPESFVNELDQTTSTESCRGWRPYCYGSCGGHGHYHSYYNNYNWSYYQPTYYYYGYNYNWNYAQSYNYGGYNYYQYNSSFSSSYSGYGVSAGYPVMY
jgi:hypothetical protein